MKETALRLASVIQSFDVEKGCLVIGGMPLDRLSMSAATTDTAAADEVQLFVR